MYKLHCPSFWHIKTFTCALAPPAPSPLVHQLWWIVCLFISEQSGEASVLCWIVIKSRLMQRKKRFARLNVWWSLLRGFRNSQPKHLYLLLTKVTRPYVCIESSNLSIQKQNIYKKFAHCTKKEKNKLNLRSLTERNTRNTNQLKDCC